MARWATSCFSSLGPWPLPPAVLPLEQGALEHVADAPGLKDDAVLSLDPLRWPVPQELDSLVAFLPMHFEAILSKLGEPSLRVAFVKSSASTLAGGRIPTVIVEIEPAGVTGELHIFCLFTDSQTVLISPPPSKYSASPGGVDRFEL